MAAERVSEPMVLVSLRGNEREVSPAEQADLKRAAKEPLDVDISDFGDEWCAGFLRGQVNALEYAILNADQTWPEALREVETAYANALVELELKDAQYGDLRAKLTLAEARERELTDLLRRHREMYPHVHTFDAKGAHQADCFGCREDAALAYRAATEENSGG